MAGDAAFVVWQLLDSNLPTGGFAHSYGLEAALQLGRFGLAALEESARVDGLLRFCRQLLRQQALLLLPLVRAGFHASAAGALGDPGAAAEGAAWWRGVRGKEGEHPTLARWAHVDLQCHVRTMIEGREGKKVSVETLRGMSLNLGTIHTGAHHHRGGPPRVGRAGAGAAPAGLRGLPFAPAAPPGAAAGGAGPGEWCFWVGEWLVCLFVGCLVGCLVG